MNIIKVTSLGLLSITLIQCADMKKRDEQQKASAQLAAVAATAAPVAAPTEPKKEEHSASPATESAHESRKVGAVAPDQALGWLKNGNNRYLNGFFRKDGASKTDVNRLSTGQTPHTIVLSCSDSRVPPEVVFDQKLGEIFVVRTAGEMVDDSVLASIEYGVEHLGANLILVMGHSSCGAVKAAFGTPAGTDTGSPYINALVAEVQPRIAQRMRSPASAGFVAEGWDNARGVSLKLMEKSKIIRDAAKSGTLRLETALYHLDSGKVEWNPAK
jgi:carbonic anhydrase